MNFSCPACQAKYFVRDEDVLGRTLKLRCHGCSSDIPIQGRRRSDPVPRPPGSISSDRLRLSLPLELSGARAVAGVIEAAPVSQAPVSEQRPSLPPPLPREVGVGEFYVGVAGVAVGPLDLNQISERIERGEIGVRTYVWHPGLSTWQRLPEVAELESLLPRLSVKSRAAMPGPPPSSGARTLEERLGFGYLGEGAPVSERRNTSEKHVRLGAAPRPTEPREGTALFVGLVVSLALGVALGALM